MLEWLAKFRQVDRRLIYLVLTTVVVAPFFLPMELPIYPSPPARTFYEAVEAVPADRLILIGADWDAGTQGEMSPQSEAVIAHLMKSKKRFAIWSAFVQGPLLTQTICERIAPEFGAKYGEDWVNIGYRTATFNTLMAAVKDFQGTFKTDYKNTPLEKLPVLDGIKDVKQIGMVIDFSGSMMMPTYINVFQPYKETKLCAGVTAVMGPDFFPFLDAGQIKGLLLGLKGAAEYEALVGRPSQATSSMNSQSLAHLLIILLIVLGNLGLVAQRKLEARQAEQDQGGGK